MKFPKEYEIKISKSVLEIISTLAIQEIESTTKIKDIYIKSNADYYTIYAYIAMEYREGIIKKIQKMQKNVINAMKQMTGLNVDNVNLYVYDIFQPQV